MSPIRLLLADDHPGFCNGLRAHLQQESDMDVVAVAHNGQRALALARQHHPDVVILDMEMPGESSLAVAQTLCTLDPPIQVLVLSAYEDQEYIFGVLDAGASGYLSKQEPLRAITEAVRGTARGETGWLSRKVAAMYMQRHRSPASSAQRLVNDELSQREREVFQLVAHGMTNPAVADCLCIAENTVKKHVHALYTKLPVDTRAQLVAWAWRSGVVAPTSDSKDDSMLRT
ncbi:MAG: response regulator transcription factor [Longimonas sp.]|uniref:response regulator n=1 Tax=Longimonas sp. TaxID=2039626 RepID=UPI003977129A